MKFKNFQKRWSEKGQTAVEYILLFSVVVIMTISFMKYVQERVLGDPEQCASQGNQSSFSCQIYGVFNSYQGDYSKFRYFRIL